MCRAALYTYEHIEPLFADATSHDASAICLLCPSCQSLATKGRLPKATIAAAYKSIQATVSPEPSRDSEFFVPYEPNVTIELGTCSFELFTSIIELNGRNLLSFIPTGGVPAYVVQGEFRDEVGNLLFQIASNEWIGPVDVFDVEQIGTRLTIRRSDHHVLFEATKDPTRNIVRVSRLDMLVPPFHIHLTDEILAVGQSSIDGKRGTYFILYKWQFKGGRCAIALDAALATEFVPTGISVGGGGGATINGTGVVIGAGAQQMLIAGGMIVLNECGDLGSSAAESFRRRIENAKEHFVRLVRR